MDPRERADARLLGAQARSAAVVTPLNMSSPMDSTRTQQIPRAAIAKASHLSDAESTDSIPAPGSRRPQPFGGQQPALARNNPTIPLPNPTQPAPANKPMTQYIQAPAARKPDPQDQGGDGLIPTTPQQPDQRSISALLDGEPDQGRRSISDLLNGE
jgi:hypothetical protein